MFPLSCSIMLSVAMQQILFRLDTEDAHKLRVLAVSSKTTVQALMSGYVGCLLESQERLAEGRRRWLEPASRNSGQSKRRSERLSKTKRPRGGGAHGRGTVLV